MIFRAALSSAILAITLGLNANEALADVHQLPIETSPPIVDQNFTVVTDDGFPLEGKIDYLDGSNKLPVIIILEGSGVVDVDFTMIVPPLKPSDCKGATPDGNGGKIGCYKVDQLLADRIAPLGMAVVRLAKRGVTLDASNPFQVNVDFDQFATSTLSRREKDVEDLITTLKSFPQLDLSHVYLYGVSEGTAISNLYANANPNRVSGMLLIGPVLDSVSNLMYFQSVTVQYDQLLKVADTDHDQRISRAEFNSALQSGALNRPPPGWWPSEPLFRDVLSDCAVLKIQCDFDYFDLDHDGYIERYELESRLIENFWKPLAQSIANKNPTAYANLGPISETEGASFQIWTDWFNDSSLGSNLLNLNMPVHLYIGDQDLNTPISQLDWFSPLLQQANKPNINVHVIPGDHHNGPGSQAAAIQQITDSGWNKAGR